MCNTLVHPDLKFNEIGVEGVGRISEVLVQCKASRHLVFRHRGIGDDGAGKVVRVLRD